MPSDISDILPFGIYEDTGLPHPGIDADALTAFIDDGADTAAPKKLLQRKVDEADPAKSDHFGTTSRVDAAQLSQAGWAVIFAPSADKAIREALQPLLDYRHKQVGDERLFKIYEGDQGFQSGDDAVKWLARDPRRTSLNVVNPFTVPYYVLIVGPPDEIPFEFQYGLDLNWAVGRLWFSTAQEFRNYAESVIRYETMPKPPTSRQMAMFAPRHDPATNLFHDQVAAPLLAGDDLGPVGANEKFALRPFLGDAATKNNLHQIFNGSIDKGPPALLFTGGHGMQYGPDDPRQPEKQGALLCQDWPGQGGAKPDFYFTGEELGASAKVHGLVHFMFACFGGGWPEFDDYSREAKRRTRIAPHQMLARLPQALL